MQLFGLIGRHLLHSFSKTYFENKFKQEKINAAFNNFDILPNELESFLNTTTCIGCSITMPYKNTILPLLIELSPEAKAIGAVNCIQKNIKGWVGHNTDWLGFEYILNQIQLDILQKALILGNGGAAQAVKYVLNKKSIPFVSVSRKMEPNTISYMDIDEKIINNYSLIVNTTPLGMFPDTQYSPPIPYTLLNNNNKLIDLIYNPEETLFLQKAKEVGAQYVNGLAMLHVQAEAAWQLWQL